MRYKMINVILKIISHLTEGVKFVSKRYLEIIVTVNLLIMFPGLLTFTYFKFLHQNPPIEFTNLPFPTDKDQYKRGDVINRFGSFCKFTNASATIRPRLEGSIIYTLADFKVAGSPKGCYEFTFSDLRVPKEAELGVYKLTGVVEYQVNPIAKREVRWETEEFEVVE